MKNVKEQIIKLYGIKDTLEEEGYEHLAKEMLNTIKSLESNIKDIEDSLTKLKEKISSKVS